MSRNSDRKQRKYLMKLNTYNGTDLYTLYLRQQKEHHDQLWEWIFNWLKRESVRFRYRKPPPSLTLVKNK